MSPFLNNAILEHKLVRGMSKYSFLRILGLVANSSVKVHCKIGLIALKNKMQKNVFILELTASHSNRNIWNALKS